MIVLIEKENVSRLDTQTWLKADMLAAVSADEITILKNRFSFVGPVSAADFAQMIEAAIADMQGAEKI